RKARQEKKLKLKDIAKKLNINLKYLRALEAGEYKKLPTGIYEKKFLMEYAVYLGLNYNELIKAFTAEKNTVRHQGQKELFSKQVIKKRYFLALPKIIKSIIIVIVIIICFTYLGFGLKKIIAPPYLFVYSPEKNFITQNRFIKVIGKTEEEAQIIINGATVLSDATGEFAKTVNLKNGINIITITACKKYGRDKTVIRQVLVK
ncbi:MAG: helix-turn-helix domain-containing protein, partial [Patescibacteria group bacterium]|nr:helix-turn-helix domain-containing protein [Patescibacteria group bacterium]